MDLDTGVWIASSELSLAKIWNVLPQGAGAAFKIFVANDVKVLGDGTRAPLVVKRIAEAWSFVRDCNDYPGWLEELVKNNIEKYRQLIGVSPRQSLDKAYVITGAQNFGHWFQEVLPKVYALENLGYDGKYIIPNWPLGQALLEYIGVVAERIVYVGDGAVDIESLYFTSTAAWWEFGKYPALLRQYRNHCLDRQDRYIGPKRRIYLARRSGTVRSVANDAEVTQVLGDLEFERVEMELLTLHEQVSLVSSAEILLGPHGAGMVLSQFMSPGSTVVELFAPTYVNPCLSVITEVFDIDYRMLVSRLVQAGGEYRHGQFIEVDIPMMYQSAKNIIRKLEG